MNSGKRELLSQLGRSFELLKTAHYSIRASVRDEAPTWQAAVRQWALAVETYTNTLERLVRTAPRPLPQAPEEVVDHIRKKVVGRIVAGKFVWVEEFSE